MRGAPEGHYWSHDECRWVSFQRSAEIPDPRPATALETRTAVEDSPGDDSEAGVRVEAPELP